MGRRAVTPQHHVPEDMLLQRSAGTLPEALDILVACHLTLCPTCRATTRQLDAVGGAMLASAPPAALPQDALQATLARIRSAPNDARNAESPSLSPIPPGDPVLPRALLRYTGPFAAIPWKRRFLGFGRFDLPVEMDGRQVRLIRVPPGWTFPEHEHESVEHTMILTGGYHDDGVAYARGDVAIHEPKVAHTVRVDPGEPCTILLVHSGRLLPRTRLGHLMTWMVDG